MLPPVSVYATSVQHSPPVNEPISSQWLPPNVQEASSEQPLTFEPVAGPELMYIALLENPPFEAPASYTAPDRSKANTPFCVVGVESSPLDASKILKIGIQEV